MSTRSTQQEVDQRTGHYLLATFWETALGFWRNGWTAWLLTATIITITLMNLFVQYRINVWNRHLFDALTVISVGHRPELEKFHDRKISLAYHPDGARLVRDENLAWPRRPSARMLSRLLAREKNAA